MISGWTVLNDKIIQDEGNAKIPGIMEKDYCDCVLPENQMIFEKETKPRIFSSKHKKIYIHFKNRGSKKKKIRNYQ